MTRSTRTFLTQAQERELVAKMRAGDAAARDRIIVALIPLANRMASRYARDCNKSDLRQAAYIGLIRGVDHFDPDRSDRVSTCARYWIHNELREYIRSSCSVVTFPMHELRRRVAEGLLQRDVSLDEPLHGMRTPRVEFLRDANSPTEDDVADMVDADAQREALRCGLQILNARELEIVVQRHLCGADEAKTLKELSEALGVSRERIRQIEANTMAKLYQVAQRNLGDRRQHSRAAA